MPARRLTLLLITGLLAAVSCPAAASAETVVSCPVDPAASGDGTQRGFYLSDYPGTNLDQVTLNYAADTAGTYTFTLTARLGTFDGPVIGAPTVTSGLPAGGGAVNPVNFSFGGVPVARGSTITFAQTVTGPDSVGFNTGTGAMNVQDGACPGVTETAGVSPPLSGFRRDTVGLTVTQLPSSFSAKLAGRALAVSVSLPGTVAVSDAAAPLSAQPAKKKKRRLALKPSSATGTAPTISVPLRLTKLAKQKLRQKGKVTAKARVTFTPTGGTVTTQTITLKIKGKKKKK
jgi:hypothetical protein